MKTLSINKGLLVLSLVTLSFIACKKDKTEDDKDTTSATENAMADAAFNDVANISDEASTGTLVSYRDAGAAKVLTSCATITIDLVNIPHRITIDFGTINCACKDSVNRRGKIFVDFNGQYRDSASTHTISFSNYYVNDNKIDGTKSVTNNGRNASGHLTFSISINGTITWSAANGGGTSTHVSSRSREWIAGESTVLIWSDDVYLISGSSNGTNRNGGTYTMSTVSPLRKRIGFKHFTEGIIDFTPSGKATRRIDFGYLSGAEDNLARVTINGTTFTILLK